MQKVEVVHFLKPRKVKLEGWCFFCGTLLLVPEDQATAPVCKECSNRKDTRP